MTLEQIDLVKRMVARYPADFEIAYTAADVRRIHRAGKIASLIGIEGGHQINNSLAVLRQMYDLGARYMTLTHVLTTGWADSATDAPRHHGLTPFGEDVVREMNRLGMLVDLSHVSPDTMRAALRCERGACDFLALFRARARRPPARRAGRCPQARGGERRRGDGEFRDGLRVRCRNRWEADRSAEVARYESPPYGGLYIGQPDRAKAALAAWEHEHPKPQATLAQVADHIDHIRQVAGIDHVGLGSDFDGIPDTPRGLEGVDKYPDLLAELMRRGWSDGDVAKVAGANVLRVMADCEHIAATLRSQQPSEAVFEASEPQPSDKH